MLLFWVFTKAQNHQPIIYEIPTVVHIIGNTTTEAEVVAIIDKANILLAQGISNDPENSDTQIRLKLAEEIGLCANKGVYIIPYPYTQVNIYFPKNTIVTGMPDNELQIKNLSRKDASKYLNIWVVDEIKYPSLTALDPAGHALFPQFAQNNPVNQISDYSLKDGIIIEKDYFFRNGRANDIRKNVLIHELGHYLNLHHTFGDTGSVPQCETNQNCTTVNDYVCDTNSGNTTAPITSSDCDQQAILNACNGIPYPVKNIMSYARQCTESFTAGQRERILATLNNVNERNGLLIPHVPTVCTAQNWKKFPYTDIPINTQVTISAANGTDWLVEEDIIIHREAILIIEAGVTLHFKSKKRLMVYSDGVLNLHGTLSNACCNQPWTGVQVFDAWYEGSPDGYNPNSTQFTTVKTFANAKIENAEVGVNASWSSERTRLIFNGSYFLNNNTAVTIYDVFMKPRPKYLFEGCTFTVDDNYLFSGAFKHIGLNTIQEILVNNCIFENKLFDRPFQKRKFDFGTGIQSVDSGFEVKGGSFTGLGYGIWVETGEENRTFSVTKVNFNRCFYGLLNKGVSGTTVQANDFILGNLPKLGILDDNAIQSNIGIDWQYGTYFANNLSILEYKWNSFSVTSGTNKPTFTFGTTNNQIGTTNNLVHDNTYNGLDRGNLVVGTCGNINDGIRFKCNHNSETTIVGSDFRIINYALLLNPPSTAQTIISGGTIRASQDDDGKPMGNTFDKTSSNFDIDNESNIQPINYYYYEKNAVEQPEKFVVIIGKPPTVKPISVALPATCSPKPIIITILPPPTVIDCREDFWTYDIHWRSAYNEWLSMSSEDQKLYEQKKVEVNSYRIYRDEKVQCILGYYQRENTTFSKDSLIKWLRIAEMPSIHFQLARAYWSRHDITNAVVTLNEMPALYGFDDVKVADIEGVKNIIETINTDSIKTLSPEKQSFLRQKAYSYIGETAAFAQAILAQLGEWYAPYTFDPQRSEAETFRVQGKIASNEIKVYPNPTNGLLNFAWDKSSYNFSVLKIYDLSGKIQFIKNLEDRISSTTIDFSLSPEGLYFYELKGEYDTQSGKFILQQN